MSSLVTASQAAELLGVKLPTLYAYVSRGLLRSLADPEDARRRLYHRADVERLRARAGAASGHAPVAAGALRWGEPVLEQREQGFLIRPRASFQREPEGEARANQRPSE